MYMLDIAQCGTFRVAIERGQERYPSGDERYSQVVPEFTPSTCPHQLPRPQHQ
jgi:hypothetical protein